MKTRNEIKYLGQNACLAIWRKRPDDIIRVYLEKGRVDKFSALLRWCAEKRKAYHLVDTLELEKVSDSVHHEGIVIIATTPPITTDQDAITAISSTQQSTALLYLDRIKNPHNVGAIIRSCANFGISKIFGRKGELPRLSGSLCRVAEGGAEFISLVETRDSRTLLNRLKSLGFTIIGTSSRRSKPLYTYRFPQKSVIILGSEGEGISDELLRSADVILQVPGTGAVESLNVASTTAVILGEYWRQQQTGRQNYEPKRSNRIPSTGRPNRTGQRGDRKRFRNPRKTHSK